MLERGETRVSGGGSDVHGQPTGAIRASFVQIRKERAGTSPFHFPWQVGLYSAALRAGNPVATAIPEPKS
jgi:hypothetical protein